MKGCKKLLALAFALSMLIGAILLFSFTASAATSGYYTYTVSNGEATITKCSISISGDVAIPSTLGGYPVTSIGNYAFRDCSGLTSVTIPTSVTSIGSEAFYNCSCLTSVTIGSGVNRIAHDAFYNTAYYNDAKNWDSGVLYIGNYLIKAKGISGEYAVKSGTRLIADEAFYGRSGLTSVMIPDSVTSIGSEAFYNCSGLTSVTIGGGVTSIGNYAFYNCSGLTSVTIPDSVSSIGSGAFYDCSGLTSVTIGSGVTSIGGSAFLRCSGLTSVTIPDSVTSIGGSAFYGCSGLTSITIPDGVTSIGSSAFYNTAYYNNDANWTDDVLYIGNHLINAKTFLSGAYSVREGTKTIADSAFYGCSGLTSVTIPDSVTSSRSAFSGCTGLTEVHITDLASWCGIAFAGAEANPLYYAHNLYLNGTLVTDLVIPDSATIVGDYAFSGCSGLTSVTIPDSVTSIGFGTFYGCSGLTSISLPFVGNKPHAATDTWQYPFGYIFGTLSYTGGTATKQYYYGSSSSSTTSSTFYIPSSLKSVTITGSSYIPYGAFYNCSELTSVTIPDSVTSIGNFAFYDCSGLTEVHITDLASWCGIAFAGAEANPLYYAHNLYLNGTLVTDLVIPDSVTSIGKWAFSDCSSLTSVTIPDSVTSIGFGTFYGCSGLTSISLPFVGDKPHTAYDTYQYPFGYIFGTSSYTGGTATRQDYYGDSTSSMTSTTYYIPSALKSVTITGSSDILYGAFVNCSMLTSVTIPDSVTSIGNYAFAGCSGLTSVTIPNSVTSIGIAAFGRCSGLTSISLPFVGNKPHAATDTWQYPFGYIFGTFSYTGGTATRQYYYGSSTSSTTSETYYIPSALKSVTITGSSDIPYGAFNNCNGLTSVTIGGSVANIGDNAFFNCTGLTSIWIGTGVTSISDSAFSGCTGLTTLILDCPTVYPWFRAVTTITSVTIAEHVTYIRDTAFSDCTGLTSLTIKNGVKGIGGYAFEACSGLTNVTIPNSVTSIGIAAFGRCSGLTSITVDAGNPNYDSRGNCNAIIETATNCLITGCNNTAIPNSVASIGAYAFYNCSGLTSVTLGNDLKNIGNYAFYGCSELANISIGRGIKSIGSSAFGNCTKLTAVNCASLAKWCETEFYGYDANPLYYAKHLYLNGELVTELSVPYGTTCIGNYAFYNCIGLTSVTIPTSVTSIDGSAFSGCSGLTSVTIGNGVKSIGESAFSGCSGLTSVTIPTSVTSIGNSAFNGCSELAEITLPFVGDQPHTAGDTYQYPFGYIFGTSSYDGGTATTQYYYGSSTSSTTSKTYYIPSALKSVTITGSSDIPYGAFYNCSGLTSVTIGNSVKSIGNSAFNGCSELAEMTLPFVGNKAHTASDLYQYPFGYIFGTSSYTGGTATRQDYYGGSTSAPTLDTYYIPSALKSVTITGSSYIPYGAFYNCNGLTSVTIPNSVTRIGGSAFYGCSGLTSITVDAGNPNYDSRGNCNAIIETATNCLITGCKDTTIPGSVTSIGDGAFYGCTGLTSVTIPDSVESIGKNAFYNCSGLTSVTIPDSVTSIGWGAFYGCSGLMSVTIPDSVTSIDGSAFYGCSGLTRVTISDSVTSIGNEAFRGCSGLTSVTIPDSVTSIGYEAFRGCSGLTSISLPFVGNKPHAANDTYQYPFGYIFGTSSYTGGTATTQYYYGSSTSSTTSKTYYIPSALRSVTITGSSYIPYGAFYNCNGLTSVTIPDSVTSIGECAFRGCSELTSVTIGNGVTSIGKEAFYNCSGLSKVQITDLFAWCKISFGNSSANPLSYAQNLYLNGTLVTDLVIPGGVTSIGYAAFYGYRGLTSVTIPDSVTSIGKSAFSNCTGLTSVTIGNGVQSIGERAFYGCSKLTAVHISDIASWCGIAFADAEANPLYYAHNLYLNGTLVTDLVIPDSVTSISFGTFYGCSELKSVTIPDSVTSIGSGAFYVCSGLKSVTIGSGVTSIGKSAFAYCSGLKSVTIPDSVTSIGNYVFYECSGMTSVTIGNGVQSIGQNAFAGCSGLTDVYFCGTEREWNAISIGDGNNCLTGAKIHYNYCAHPHTHTEHADATCTEPGYDRTVCDDCGVTVSETVLSALGHDLVDHEAQAASCTEIGWAAYDTCTRCDYTTYEEIPATGHTPADAVKENEIAATCTETGSYDEVVYCSVCGAELSRETKTIDALGHDLVHHDAQAATCTEIGWAAYQTCSRCDYSTFEETPALGHNIVADPAAAATCTETGLTEGQHCTRCDYKVEQTVIPALGHDLVTDPAVAATCTATGLTEGKHCTRCDYKVAQEVVPMTAHSYKDGKCTVCGAKDPDYKPPVTTNPFNDVKEGEFYYEAVLWAVNADPQVTSGTSATTFSPNATCTRAQVVTFLWRAKGCPEPKTNNNPFNDVKAGDYYYKAVLWAVENGITAGTSATTFSPNAGCTRAQVVTFLWRTEGQPKPTSSANPFTDVKGGYYYDAVLWAVEKGITAGTSATTFSPDATCTRGQIVTFLYRAFAA